MFQLGELSLRGAARAAPTIEALRRLSNDPVPAVRAQIAHRLGKLTPHDRQQIGLRPALDRLRTDESAKVRDRAEASLEGFAG